MPLGGIDPQPWVLPHGALDLLPNSLSIYNELETWHVPCQKRAPGDKCMNYPRIVQGNFPMRQVRK